MTKISVLIEEGLGKAIEGIPIDFCVEVKNYDVDRLDKHALSKDENGRPCDIREWHAPEWLKCLAGLWKRG
jgi:hypothetical protein